MNEPYDYDKMKDRSSIEKYKMLFPIRMQFLTVGECYEIGVQGGCTEAYMLGDMDDVVGNGESLEWALAGDLAEAVPGEKYRFRVTAEPCTNRRWMQVICCMPAFHPTHRSVYFQQLIGLGYLVQVTAGLLGRQFKFPLTVPFH